MTEDRWLSLGEIVIYICVKPDRVFKRIAEKKMPSHWMGRLWKFHKEEVEE